jgi:hypothetical protein
VLHAVVFAALALLGAPWKLKVAGAIAALAHSIVLRPRRTLRIVLSAGRVAVPELDLEGLTLGRRTRHCGLWIRLDLRGAGRVLDILLLADQIEPKLWRMFRSELARLATDAETTGDPGRDLR